MKVFIQLDEYIRADDRDQIAQWIRDYGVSDVNLILFPYGVPLFHIITDASLQTVVWFVNTYAPNIHVLNQEGGDVLSASQKSAPVLSFLIECGINILTHKRLVARYVRFHDIDCVKVLLYANAHISLQLACDTCKRCLTKGCPIGELPHFLNALIKQERHCRDSIYLFLANKIFGRNVSLLIAREMFAMRRM